MADTDRRHHHHHHNGNNRKRRQRDDDESYRRNTRRRTDERSPAYIRVRNRLREICDSPLKRWHEEVQEIGALVCDNVADDDMVRPEYLDLTMRLCLEQPLKTPFVAAVALVVNARQPEIVAELLEKAARTVETSVAVGEWRDAKLALKLLACLQGCLSDTGLFPVLEELFTRAVDLQTASSDDTIGTEIVKMILLTIPYIMAAAPGRFAQQAAELMDKTDIIASEPHALQILIDPYYPETNESSPSASTMSLLQQQLQGEAANEWPLKCVPRPWEMPLESVEAQEQLDNAQKHDLPAIVVPATVVAGAHPLFPEVYFSVYGEQDIETVPPITDLAASLIRDAMLDSINILDYNRNVTAKCLIELDCFFAPGTFVHRATPFDRLRHVEEGKSTWKPEDVALDAVFSQLFQLPTPECKVVYYHSVLTEACKLAPAAIAPSLGRAIRFLYKMTPGMDLELGHRFLGWFSHHLSNFGFMWKWAEWAEDVELSDLDPLKAFIVGALDKEVRLSFAQRIRKTVPEPYQKLLGPDKDKDVPDFKFDSEGTPFHAEGQEIATLLKRKATDEDFQAVMERIHAQAIEHGLDPLVTSTDVFMTSVLWVGSKSLSHVLACIDRTKVRLLDAGAASEPARGQIISSVMEYWSAHPGVALCIIEKLLNYSILTPMSVASWALVGAGSKNGFALAQPHVFEMVFHTVAKVTSRMRLVVSDPAIDADTKAADTAAMRSLFAALEDALVAWAGGDKDEILDGDVNASEARLLRQWGGKWLRVFRRRGAIEEAFLVEAARARGGEGDMIVE